MAIRYKHMLKSKDIDTAQIRVMKPVLYCTCYNMNTHTYYVSTIYINMQINYPTKHSTPKRKFDFEFLQNIPAKAKE